MTKKKSTTSRSSSAKGQRKKVSATRGGTTTRRGAKKKRTTASKRTTQRPARRSVDFRLNIRQKGLIVGIVLIFLTAVLVLSILSPNQSVLTAGLEGLLFRLFGWGGYFMPLVLAGGGFYLVLWGMDQPPSIPGLRLVGLGIMFLVFEGFASLIAYNQSNGLETMWDIARRGHGGGYLGGSLTTLGIDFIDTLGTVFVLVVLGIIGTILVTGISRTDLGILIKENLFRRGAPQPDAVPTVGADGLLTQPPLPLGKPRSRITPPPSASTPPPDDDNLPLPAVAQTTPAPVAEPEKKSRRQRRQAAKNDQPEPAEASPVILGQPQSNGQRAANWTLPVLSELLESGSDASISNDSIREQVEVIEHTLDSFGAPATVVDINQGPTVTQFGVEPQFIQQRSGKRTKVKVGKIASLADDIALALAAHSVRIQAPVPGKGYVGIEVPNPSHATVSLRDILEAREFSKIKSPLRIGLGQNVAGKPIGADLTKMPHLLIAGTTGSGKSVCVNGIIACLLLNNTPEELKFVMVDPKRVELTGYNGIPHLAAPVVVDMDRVIGVLQWATREMENRYKLFAEHGARNITEYNKKIGARKDQKLPYIVIVIDELADLMMLSPEETERGISRLAQMARATGMHMVIATQRPSVDVVTGLIKANFPARIAFAVASATDSRVILDSTGAERLLGRGDMLFQSPDAAAPVRLQGCFVSDGELNALIEYWKTARRYNLITEADAVPRSSLPTVPLREETPPTPVRDASNGAEDAAQPLAVAPAVEDEPADEAPKRKRISKPAGPHPLSDEVTITQLPSPDDMPKVAADAVISPPQVNLGETAPLIESQPTLFDEIADDGDGEAPSWDDEVMPKAIEMVRDLGKASTSLLQRRFRIGYTRSARIIDAMEDMGIIGPPTGTSKAREVYVDAANRALRTGSPPEEDDVIPFEADV